MATPAQLAEKVEKERQRSPGSFATPAQLAEKGREVSDSNPPPYAFATSGQLAEKAGAASSKTSCATPAQLSEKVRERPPPLPPRVGSSQGVSTPVLDDAQASLVTSEQQSSDLRSSSTQSLVPSETGRQGRRTLLNIFIHGFLGNEESFQNFPAHIHNLLTAALAETHVVHTKIYPRYKSRKAIDFARDDFGVWLEPHENDSTDVILFGHSIGGILSAEVALQHPYSNKQRFRHRILGTICFDTPFLGMHPGVVVSGIGSLFRREPDPSSSAGQDSTSGTTTPSTHRAASSIATPTTLIEASSQTDLMQGTISPSGSEHDDPYFNPPFSNDVRRPERTGGDNLLHFVSKHAEGFTTHAKLNGLSSAASNYFMSHLEFGGCLADYSGLQQRYRQLRNLEDVDDLAGRHKQPPARRIRFVNYYTASTGRPKASKTSSETARSEVENVKPDELDVPGFSLGESDSRSLTPAPSITIEESDSSSHVLSQQDDDLEGLEDPLKFSGITVEGRSDIQELPQMQTIESMPMDEDFDVPVTQAGLGAEEAVAKSNESSGPPLPAIPEAPIEPPAVDLEAYADKDARKIAEKEQKQAMKVYQQALKYRDNAIKDRKKLVEKRERKAREDQEKRARVEQKRKAEEDKGKAKAAGRQAAHTADPLQQGKQHDGSKKDKKFCMLPDTFGGQNDTCWVRVYMEEVDEVGAHCGLFFPGPHYEGLLGDVGARVEQWIGEDATRRAIIAAETAD